MRYFWLWLLPAPNRIQYISIKALVMCFRLIENEWNKLSINMLRLTNIMNPLFSLKSNLFLVIVCSSTNDFVCTTGWFDAFGCQLFVSINQISNECWNFLRDGDYEFTRYIFGIQLSIQIWDVAHNLFPFSHLLPMIRVSCIKSLVERIFSVRRREIKTKQNKIITTNDKTYKKKNDKCWIFQEKKKKANERKFHIQNY